MPTYEYRCPEGHDFEQFVLNMSKAAAELPCPVCGRLAARRISAGAGLVFKGSGFYITDYGKDGKKDQRQGAAAAAGTSAGEKSGGDTPAAAGDAAKTSTDAKTSAGTEKAAAKPAAAPAGPAQPSSPPKKAGGTE